jgi:phosphoethanolamine N-methyltransferase
MKVLMIQRSCFYRRFTGHLANHSNSLHTVDFIASFVEKNRQTNGHRQHVTFECNDAMKIHPPGGLHSLDVVFTNWLMMYLSDDEVQMLAKRVLSWLRVGGYFFVRESCFHPSGNMPRNSGNPTFYRDPSKYCELFQVITNENGPLFEGGHEFELQYATSVKTYIRVSVSEFKYF